jgi:hypothetical protein
MPNLIFSSFLLPYLRLAYAAGFCVWVDVWFAFLVFGRTRCAGRAFRSNLLSCASQIPLNPLRGAYSLFAVGFNTPRRLIVVKKRARLTAQPRPRWRRFAVESL